MMINSYRDLKVWQMGMALAKASYFLTRAFPKAELFGMTSQIRRAAASIPANIAEGNRRENTGEYIQFLRIAQGSLKELETHLILAHEVEICTQQATQPLLDQADQLGRMLRALIRSLQERTQCTPPSDCFETFPFPDNFETDGKLEAVGKEYYEFRAALMVKNNEGLTKTYNRFHDPNETSAEIKKLRELHAAMDRAVLDAYGWTDLQPTCEFLLDYDEEEDEDAEARPAGRGRKKPWRYRWPDEFRDTVLACLLELNKQRAEAEALAGATAKPTKPGRQKLTAKQTKKGLF